MAEDFNVIIHTTRLDLKINIGWRYPELVSILEKWLEKHGFHWTDMRGKPVAVAYVDDRAVLCRPKQDLMAFEMAIGLANLEAENLKQKKWR